MEIAQGLKPFKFVRLVGTTEVVPFHKAKTRRISVIIEVASFYKLLSWGFRVVGFDLWHTNLYLSDSGHSRLCITTSNVGGLRGNKRYYRHRPNGRFCV